LFPVSVVILTKDEEKNTEDALTSDYNGCAEVVVQGTGEVVSNPCTTGAVAAAMKTALEPRLSGEEIRESVRHLDFEDQLKKLVKVCIGDAG